ncbi:MAG: carbohydrate kinase [Clostridia bacterium]|nr:carbohydrate kinase [Clostridia bacterium]
MLFLGIDIGTQGVRSVVVDESGQAVAGRSAAFASLNSSCTPGWYEQRPQDWVKALEDSLTGTIRDLNSAGYRADMIESLSIDGTSGTVVPLDQAFQPLSDALMYNDPRAKAQAVRVGEAMRAHEQKMGFRFNASYSLPRILWMKEERPDLYGKTRVFAHEADYIAGLLCGEYTVSDYSNALKTGYDLIDGIWPVPVSAALGIDAEKLPSIAAPGAKLAPVCRQAAERFGLSEKTWVTGGSTDGYASALAAGAVREGDWASIIGTTFVLKGVTRELIIDPNGSSYSHRLPGGEWLLGGASNLGGRCLNECAAGQDFAALDRQSESLIPTGVTCYPLSGVGERFPFVDPNARAFYSGNIFGGRLYPALMEGVAYGERFALERMQAIGCPVGDVIYASGGACRSDLWLKIRASVLGKELRVPSVVDAAMGSALLAASGSFGSLSAAADSMIRTAKTAEPDGNLTARYNDLYGQFVQDITRCYRLEAEA